MMDPYMWKFSCTLCKVYAPPVLMVISGGAGSFASSVSIPVSAGSFANSVSIRSALAERYWIGPHQVCSLTIFSVAAALSILLTLDLRRLGDYFLCRSRNVHFFIYFSEVHSVGTRATFCRGPSSFLYPASAHLPTQFQR